MILKEMLKLVVIMKFILLKIQFLSFTQTDNSGNSGSSTLLEINIPHGKTTFDRVNNITSLGLLIGVLMILYAISIRVFMSTTSKTKGINN